MNAETRSPDAPANLAPKNIRPVPGWCFTSGGILWPATFTHKPAADGQAEASCLAARGLPAADYEAGEVIPVVMLPMDAFVEILQAMQHVEHSIDRLALDSAPPREQRILQALRDGRPLSDVSEEFDAEDNRMAKNVPVEHGWDC